MNTKVSKNILSSAKSFWLIIGLVLLSLFLKDLPVFSLLLAPFHQFEVMLHEMSHAIACVLTGGSVSGLTIVEDGNGHGGLTFTRGGIPFIYSQAGYMGETLWGCSLVLLSRFPGISRFILIAMGLLVAATSIYFMPGAVFRLDTWAQGLGSLFWGLTIAAALVFSGWKLKEKNARFILLFMAVQSCLSSLDGLQAIVMQSLGAYPGSWSDATNMEKLTMIPAPFWAISWALFSVGMLSAVMWLTFKLDRKVTKTEAPELGAGENKTRRLGAASFADSLELELEKLRAESTGGQTLDIKQKKRDLNK